MIKYIYGGNMEKLVNLIKKYISIIVKYIKLFIHKIITLIKKIKEKINAFLKRRKEDNKQNKVKIFFVGVGSYIGSVFSYLISRPKTKEIDINKEIKKINKNISNIEKSIENETTPLVLKMYKREINKKINKLKNIKNIKSREESKLVKDEEERLLNLNKKIEIKEKELKNIDYEEKNENIEEENIIDKIDNNIEISKKEKVVSDVKKTTNKVLNNTKKVSKKIKKGVLIASTAALGTISNIILKKNKIKEIKSNKKIENHKEDLKLKEQIREFNNIINKTYNEVNKKKDENELINLKEKIVKLKDEYIKLTQNEKFSNLKNYKNINNIDPNHLVYHDKSIDNLIDYLESSIRNVKNEENNKKVKEETQKQEKKEEIELNKTDIMLAKKSIKEDISLSMKEVKKIKKEIMNIPNKYKKPNLLTRLTNFFKYSINVGISLIPFGIFKNKLLATLTSGIILNNRIRSMNSIINNSDKVAFIEYENILASLSDRKSFLENTNYVLLDTVNQINSLELKINESGFIDTEKEKLLIGLDEMKLDLLEENVKIETMLEEMNNLNKNKIKKKQVV